MSAYPTRDAQLNDVLYTPHELRKLAIEEYCLREGERVAAEYLARTGNRLTALLQVEYRYADRTLDAPIEELVRREAIAALLRDATPVERDCYDATQLYGITTYEAASAAVASALTHLPLIQRPAA